jgi:hypothetical protein
MEDSLEDGVSILFRHVLGLNVYIIGEMCRETVSASQQGVE